MTDNAAKGGAGVSAKLMHPLEVVAERQWALRVGTALLKIACVSLGTWLAVVVVLGVFSEMPLVVRVGLSLVAWGTVVGSGIWFLRPALKKRDLDTVAQRIEEALPEMQERISSAVELSRETDARYRGSPELVAHLTKQAEDDAANVDPVMVISSRNAVHWVLYLVPVLLAWLVLGTTLPGKLSSGLYQAVAPWSEVVPAAMAQVEVTPGDTQVAQGDALKISVTVADPAQTMQRVERASLVRKYPGGQSASEDLLRTGTRMFHTTLDNVQQNFAYSVSTDEATSRLYHVTVLPRPAILSMDVQYHYPEYTGLKDRTEQGKDGMIDAVVGTRVNLLVHVNQPLALEKSYLAFDKGMGLGTLNLTAVAGSGTEYAAALTVEKSGQYRIELVSVVNKQELGNKDDQLRPITARVDAPPSIVITSPTASLRVRPDDTATIKFHATDDFGVASVAAVVQVDDRPAVKYKVPFEGNDGRQINGEWPLSVAYELARQNLAEAHRITYKLVATDNCRPKAHEAESARQTLEIDRSVDSLAVRKDAAAVKELSDAIRKAQETLNQAGQRTGQLSQMPRDRVMSAEERQQTTAVKKELAGTSKDLAGAARDQDKGAFKDVARAAKEIAEKPVQNAADAMGKAELTADQPEPRQKNVATAAEQIADAQRKLDELQRKLDQAVKDRQLTHAIEDLERKQKALAEAMAKDPQNKEALTNQERELKAQTERVINEHPDLQKPVVKAEAAKIEDLERKLDKIAQGQKPLEEQTHNQAEAAGLPEKLKTLAAEQAKLNQDLHDFADKQKEPLKNAGAPALPQNNQLDPIVKDLQADKLDTAAQEQRSAANQIQQSADKLEQAAKHAQDNAPRQTDAANRAKQEAADAGAMKKASEQLRQDIQAAKARNVPPTRPGDPANQQAQELGKKLEKEAADIARDNPSQKAQADEARKAAQAGEKAAEKGQADEAQKDLAEAAKKLEEAAAEGQKQAEAAATVAPKQQGEAAEQAKGLAERQKALAEQTARTAKAVQDAQAKAAAPQSTAQQERATAEQLDQAQHDAEQIENETQNTAPELAKEAHQAGEAIKAAAKDQRDAAQAMEKGEPGTADKQQQAAEREVAKAKDALEGAKDMAQGAEPKEQTAQAKPEELAQPETGEHKPGEPGTAEKPAESGHAAAATPVEYGEEQAGKHPGEQTGEHPGQHEATQHEAGHEPGQKAGEHPGEHSGQAQHSGKGLPHPTGMSQVAQAMQRAHELQEQAAQGDPTAAKQAAQALQTAKQAMAENHEAGSPETASGQAGREPGGEPGQEAGKEPGSHSAKPGKPGEGTATGLPNQPGMPGSPKQGAQVAVGGTADHRPEAVKEVGISPSDWAHLPPLMQQQLLNAAQQKGPPAYQEMIKNYYVKIAHMQADAEPERH